MDEEEAKSKLVRRIIWIHVVSLVLVTIIGYSTSLFAALLLAPFILIVLTGFFSLKETREYRKNKEESD